MTMEDVARLKMKSHLVNAFLIALVGTIVTGVGGGLAYLAITHLIGEDYWPIALGIGASCGWWSADRLEAERRWFRRDTAWLRGDERPVLLSDVMEAYNRWAEGKAPASHSVAETLRTAPTFTPRW